ncbi:DUF4136 domain-containing protein [Robiginitalea marina]|uniref:DUF4136 domain-containing protein n=1 Tax=Robiginitalea marina TaxID=2954105 RepID=A0ABT1ATK6_9FLAO|nr:DUF4136 domain-containing protein [Robiginitalea marina]MCO5723246.1 DUF4136 domain-containing protein [Robiginitalea marina]
MEHGTGFKRMGDWLKMAPAALAFLLPGCYPDEPEFVEEYDVVYTNYAPEFNFDNAYTYALPDGVLLIDDDRGPNGPPEFIDDQFGDAILDNIRQNLNAEGWTEVDEADGPDLIVLASAFDTEFLYFYDPGYWCWYYPCWGWWYPGYLPGYVTGYRTGTVLIQVTDPNGVLNEEVPVVWTGAINGLLQGSDANIIGRIDRNLDQAFTQPPFD